MDNEFIGAIKIKDGLFIGDEFAAQDLEFIITNKVTHVINCAGKQLANYWESLGVIYLTYQWLDSQNQIVFDQNGDVVNEIYEFIEEAYANGDSVLVHSERGQSRSCCVIAAYFMKRFNWSLYKTLEFLASRRPDLEIRDSFYYQLVNLESRLGQGGKALSSNWHEVTADMDHEELLLRNTFLNARNAPLDEQLVNPPEDIEEKQQRINWGDGQTNEAGKLAIILTDEHMMKLRLAPAKTYVKSILKGSNKVFKLNTKHDDHDQENVQTSNKSTPAGGLRMNKSLKTLHEEKSGFNSSYSTILKKSVIPTGGTRVIDLNERPKNLKGSQASSLPRSSSASNFEKDGTEFLDTPSPLAPIVSNISAGRGHAPGSSFSNTKTVNETEKTREKQQSFSGNLNVPVNGFMNHMARGNNSALEDQNSERRNRQNDTIKLTERDPNVSVENIKSVNGANGISGSVNESFSKILTDPNVDKNSLNYLASKQLKLAIEKKLSQDPGKLTTTTETSYFPTAEDLATTVPTEHNMNNYPNLNVSMTVRPSSDDFRHLEKPPRDRDHDIKIPKPKEYARPTDIKVNYQVLLKNRETPPPRQREEAKKNPESVYKKALTKSSLAGSRSKENNMSASSSYFQNLFPSSIMQLNSFTPSGMSSNNIQGLDKRGGPATAKAASSQLSFGNLNTTKSFGLDKTQITMNTIQHFDKNYGSPTAYIDYLKTTVTPSSTNQANQPYPFKAQVNNFMPPSKNAPIKATHEKVDRPRSSGSNVRASTPNAALSQTNKSGQIASTSRFDRKENISNGFLKPPQPVSKLNHKPYLRSFSPSLKPNQQVRKDSPSSQLSVKYRQRSSSPSQNVAYNGLFNPASIGKPKWKF